MTDGRCWNMDAYLFRGAFFCPDCIRPILAEILGRPVGIETSTEELCDEANERTDSDRVPDGPFADGGGEADSPQHCDACGKFLKNPLTAEGRRYVVDAIAEGVEAGRITDTLAAWAWEYGVSTGNAQREAMADSPARFEQFLSLVGACREAREWARGRSLRQAWAQCGREDWMEWLLDVFGVDMDHAIRDASADGLRRIFPDVVTLERGKASLPTLAAAFSFGASPIDGDPRGYTFRIARGQHEHHGTYHGPHCPTAEDVLGCMLLDADSIEGAADWIAWAEDCGLFASGRAEDVRKAQSAFLECERERAFLRAALGKDYEAAAEAARGL